MAMVPPQSPIAPSHVRVASDSRSDADGGPVPTQLPLHCISAVAMAQTQSATRILAHDRRLDAGAYRVAIRVHSGADPVSYTRCREARELQTCI